MLTVNQHSGALGGLTNSLHPTPGLVDGAMKPFAATEDDTLRRRHATEISALQARIDQLEEAVASNRTIGAALGLVMERFHLDRTTAFAYLVRMSQDSNTKLAVVAERLLTDSEHDSSEEAAASSS